MGRIHLFEFSDQSWLPEAWRRYITEYLQFMIEHGPFDRLPSLLGRICRADRRAVALCAGSGGPWPGYLEEPHPDLEGCEILLTDIHPNDEALERAESRTHGRVTAHAEPVDATDVPAELEGPRVIVNGFHQFRPEKARAILADAVEVGEPIAIFEIMERRPASILPTLLAPLFVLILTPFVRPFRLGRLFWTYLIPLVPFLILWDGVVSALRTYSPDELRELVEGLDDYDWEADAVPAGGAGPARITYLVGTPASEDSRMAPG